MTCQGVPGDSVVKNSPASAGDAGSILGPGRSLEKKMATYSVLLPGKTPSTEELGGLQSMSHKSWTQLTD